MTLIEETDTVVAWMEESDERPKRSEALALVHAQLGKSYRSAGAVEESLGSYVKASVYYEQDTGRGQDWGKCMRNIAMLQDSMGLLTQAATSYEACRESLRETNGHNDVDYGEVTLNLSCLLLKLRSKEAERAYTLKGPVRGRWHCVGR